MEAWHYLLKIVKALPRDGYICLNRNGLIGISNEMEVITLIRVNMALFNKIIWIPEEDLNKYFWWKLLDNVAYESEWCDNCDTNFSNCDCDSDSESESDSDEKCCLLHKEPIRRAERVPNIISDNEKHALREAIRKNHQRFYDKYRDYLLVH